ncbi:INO80 complex subunit D [Nymphaea thermarum]|nr:INO80 complex subunit D [Nymphaea thermarum]
MAEERNPLPPPPPLPPLGNHSMGTVAVLPTAADIQSAIASTDNVVSTLTIDQRGSRWWNDLGSMEMGIRRCCSSGGIPDESDGVVWQAKVPKREPVNPSSRPPNPNSSSVDPKRLLEADSPESKVRPPAAMGEGEDEIRLRYSSALSVEEVVRRRSDRVRRLSGIYRKWYWTLMEEMRFKYREYYWKFGRSGFDEEEEGEGDEEERVNGGRERVLLTGRENGEYVMPPTMEEDGCEFLDGEEVGALGFIDTVGQDGGGFEDSSGENGFGFPDSGFPASGDDELFGETGHYGFGFSERVFLAKVNGKSCGFAEDFGYPEKMGRGGCEFLGMSGNKGFVFLESGFPAKGQRGHGIGVRPEEDGYGIMGSGFPSKTEKGGLEFAENSLESGCGFSGSDLPGKVGQDTYGFSGKAGEHELRVPDRRFPLSIAQGDSIIQVKTSENGAVCPIKASDSHCGFVGCKLKPMALCSFCHSHILLDGKQQLYKACSYVIKSGQAGPIICGKPVLRAAVPSLCALHFQKARMHVARSLKKAGLNMSSSNKLAPKFHVIISEYVHYIQTRRRGTYHRNQIHNKNSSAKAFVTVKDEII